MSEVEALFTEDEEAWMGYDPARCDVIEKLITYTNAFMLVMLDPADAELRAACAQAQRELFESRCELDDPVEYLEVYYLLKKRIAQGARELNEFRATLLAL